MKVIQWNATKKNQPMTGVKRYEDELFESMKKLVEEGNEWRIERIQRANNKIIGSTFVSWIFRYKYGDADIIHITEETIAPALSFRKKVCIKENKPKKVVVTCHGLIPLTYPSTIKDITTKTQWALVPKALKKADRIIAISEFTRREIMRIIGTEEDKIDVVHHGIDHSKYHPMDKEKCKKEFYLNTDEKHILVVSSNLVQKRMGIAKKVFDQIRRTREDVKMLKAGYGEVLRGDGIINVGWIQEEKMPLLFNAADVYFHPSEYESFGLPILEAMACGVPVVTSNKASIPEVVNSYNNMIDLDSNDIIGKFVDKILKNIDKGVDKKAIKQSNKFSWEKTAKETMEVYKKTWK